MNNLNIILIIIGIIVIYTLYINSQCLDKQNNNNEEFSLLSNLKNNASTTFDKILDSGTVSKIKNIF